jgi:uncharacterized protein
MADESAVKPILPNINATNRPFWEGCRRGELLVQRCQSCSRLRYPASGSCPNCLGTETSWDRMSGSGKVFTFAVFHRAYHPSRNGRVPYNVSLIELDEGPIMLSNVIDIDNAELKVGQPVEVAFEKVNEEVTIPVFRPSR